VASQSTGGFRGAREEVMRGGAVVTADENGGCSRNNMRNRPCVETLTREVGLNPEKKT